MSSYVNLWPGSPQEDSFSTTRSGQSSRLSSASRSRSSSGSGSRSPSRGSSRWSSRRRSRSRSRRRHQRTYRRSSRSYSRSRGSSRRFSRSPSRYRSRSRSRSRARSYYRRAYALTPGRRHHGFGRTVHPEEHRSWRGRARTRSRSRTPFRLSDKDRMELLEIAKANAAKALGTAHLHLPASLRTVYVPKETNRSTALPNNGAKFELLEKLTEDGTKYLKEKSSQQKNIAFSSNNSVAKPMLQKSSKATAEVTSTGSLKIDGKKSPYGLWIPV
ncbi:arginine/serine-rich protein 1 [Manis javanica]|uniref:arginine/serine-rich protein 1 n=1 Tax=Manis javanica TaxID=9974 RepID=UPI000812DFE3